MMKSSQFLNFGHKLSEIAPDAWLFPIVMLNIHAMDRCRLGRIDNALRLVGVYSWLGPAGSSPRGQSAADHDGEYPQSFVAPREAAAKSNQTFGSGGEPTLWSPVRSTPSETQMSQRAAKIASHRRFLAEATLCWVK